MSEQTNVVSLDPWKELPERLRPLPDFPVQALPDELAALVEGLAGCYQVSAGMVAAFALGVASTAIVGRVEVQPKAKEPWYTEAGQLYVLCRGDSGERKTPVLNALKAPLEQFLDDLRKDIRAANRKLKNQEEAIRSALKRERDRDKYAAMLEEADNLEQKIKQNFEPEYLMSEMTLESICVAMNDHGGRAAIVNDEADFLMVLSGKQYNAKGNEANLGAALDGYNNTHYNGQRVGRGTWSIDRASLAICLGVQPGLLDRFMADDTSEDRGLHGRFLYFLPASMVGRRSCSGGSLPESSMCWWTKAIMRLASTARGGDPLRICFDLYAEAAYRAFFDRIEARLLDDLDGKMRKWGCKLVGSTVRLAGLLALLDGAETVSRRHWDAAETIADEYLTPCAKRLFLGDVEDVLPDKERRLVQKMRGLDSFREADFWRETGRYIYGDDESGKQEFLRDLFDLCGKGYVRPAKEQPRYFGSGRPPSMLWEVNPALWKKAGTRVEEVEI